MEKTFKDYSQDKKAVWSWAMYDWGNSAFATTVMAGFFPIFFKMYYSAGVDVVESTAKLGIANSLAGFVVAIFAPILGTISDYGGYKKKFLFLFCYLGVLMTACLAILSQGQWLLATILYALGTLGFSGSNVFYDSLLPSISTKKNIDFVSSLGYAMGYLGGGILFALNVLMYQKYEWFGMASAASAIKWSFVSVGAWWAFFTLPILFWVKEPVGVKTHNGSLGANIVKGLKELKHTLVRIKNLKMLLILLVAFFLYNDGVGTTIKMAVNYGMSIGFETSDLIMALLLVNFVGFPGAIIFGKIAQRFHPKKPIYFAILVYIFAVTWASQMQEVWEFYVLAVLIGLVQGGIQALSRSYYSRLIPEERAGEFYGLYNLMGKFNGIIGPLIITVTVLLTRSQRVSIFSISILFVLGGFLLSFVDEKKGQEEMIKHDMQ